MPEISDPDASAVALFTQGRLPDDERTESLLNSVLREARRYCGWHVTPVHVDEQFTLDGRGGSLLRLPTRNLIELTSLTEDGVDLDLAQLTVSRRGLVRKRSRGFWTENYGGITVEMTHGFTEDEALDWYLGVLLAVERVGLSGGSGGVVYESAGVFQFRRDISQAVVEQKTRFDAYRLEAVA
jgi:hypothetical protein